MKEKWAHISWPSIEQFHSVRKTIVHEGDISEKNITYRAKVKLHGTNSSVQIISKKGKVIAQSRSRILSLSSDNAGFASWVNTVKEKFLNEKIIKFCEEEKLERLVIFGEWIGPGVQSGVAASKISEKVFCPFAMIMITEGSEGKQIISSSPDLMEYLVKDIPNVHVIPWYMPENDCKNLEVTFTKETWRNEEKIDDLLNSLNEYVEKIDKSDPFIKELFGVEGTGEGLVFYPFYLDDLMELSFYNEFSDRDQFSKYVFKAKGMSHKLSNKQKKSIQASPENYASIEEYAKSVCTSSRLEQGVREISDGELKFESKKIPEFVKWIQNELIKETSDEIAQLGVEAKSALKVATRHATNWYLKQMKASS